MVPTTILKVIDWTATPGARYRTDGPYSGEEFLEDVLLPAFRHAQESGSILLIDLDGVYGYASGFLEEAFGGLARTVGAEAYVRVFPLLKCKDEPYLIQDITDYVHEAFLGE